MSTKMDEEDWAYTLTVFRACLSRRGRKGNDDRRFLEALHFFTVENVRWRALPERFGPWKQRMETLRPIEQGWGLRSLLRRACRDEFAAHLIQMFDSTIVCAHVSAAGAKGGRKGRRSVARAAASPRKSTRNRTPPAISSPST